MTMTENKDGYMDEGMTELTEQDLADLEKMQGSTDAAGAAPYHTILEVWVKVLEPAKVEKKHRPASQWCSKMVQQFPEITFKDCYELRDRYSDKLVDLLGILQAEIDSDPECLKQTSAAEDRAENAVHYRNVLRDWQLRFQQWELTWDCLDPNAAVELASLGLVHNIVFAQTGMFGHLDQIQYEWTDADQAELVALLQDAQKAAQ